MHLYVRHVMVVLASYSQSKAECEKIQLKCRFHFFYLHSRAFVFKGKFFLFLFVCLQQPTSLSMIFSTYSKVWMIGSPVVGSGTSSVRWIIFSSIIVSLSLTVTCPGRNFIAIRGNFKRLFMDFVIKSSLNFFFIHYC